LLYFIGGATTKFKHDFKPCVILMTDGMATSSEALNEVGDTNDSALAVTSLLVNI
jgi:uncharacterized protein YegL